MKIPSYSTTSPVTEHLKDPTGTKRQQEHQDLRRKMSEIEGHVYGWCVVTTYFTGSELEEFVQQHVSCTPGSAMRVLRALRTKGIVQYDCIDRHASRYRIVKVTR